MDTRYNNSDAGTQLQVWWPKPETFFPAQLSEVLQGIRTNAQMQAQIVALAARHGVHAVCIGCKRTDAESADPGIDIAYLRRGNRERSCSPEFERELYETLKQNLPNLPERGFGIDIAQLRSTRINVERWQNLQSTVADLKVETGQNPYPPRGAHGR